MGDLLSTLSDVFRSGKTKLSVGIPASAGGYQFCCDQFGFPTLPKLWGMTGAGLPWWGWLVIAQSGFVLALFEYIRRRLPPDDASEASMTLGAQPTYDDTAIVSRIAELERIKGAIVDDYQRMCGMEARYAEAHQMLAQTLLPHIGLPEKLERFASMGL